MKKIGIITDDMTGTMTCGVLLAKKGIKACSYFSPDNLSGAEQLDAVILSANSRSLNPDAAGDSVRAAYRALAAQGAVYFTKRIDTTFRGGIGYEVDALLSELPEDTVAVMAAAMPDTKRVVVGGYSVIDSVVLSETGAARDVLTPVTEPHIPTMMRSQSANQVGEIHLNDVLGGKEVLMRRFAECRTQGDKIIVVDAVSNAHLETIAKAVDELGWNVVCVDPGAFTQQLALCRGFGDPEACPKGPDKEPDITASRSKVVVVAGSATDVTKRQVEVLASKAFTGCLPVNAGNLVVPGAAADQEVLVSAVVGNTCMQNPECRVLVLETAATGERLSLKAVENKHGLQPGDGSKNINQGLGRIVSQVLLAPENKAQIAGIYMTGGDTLVTVLKTLGAAGIRLIDTVQPQTNLGMIIGGPFEGTRIVGKGGLIGDDHTALNAVNRLFYEAEQ